MNTRVRVATGGCDPVSHADKTLARPGTASRMVAVRTVPASDVETVCRLHNDLTGDSLPVERLRAWHDETPGLLVGAYDEGDAVVGVCTGHAQTETEVHLAGLGVVPERRREGIGSALVERFEDEAAAAGFERVSLGSAGGYVDEFYAANGYEAESVLVRLPEGTTVEDAERRHEVERETVEDGTRKLYVAVDGYDPEYLAAVRSAFDDDEAIHIVAKSLAE